MKQSNSPRNGTPGPPAPTSFLTRNPEPARRPKKKQVPPASDLLYEDLTIPVPKTGTDEAFHKLPEFIANEKNESRVRWHWRFDTPEKFQTMMKNHYRMATEVDTTCGRVLAELEKEGLLDNTLVIFTGDNGIQAPKTMQGRDLSPLYVSDQDPFEENDLIRDPAQKERLVEMRKRFEELKASAK